MELPTLSIPASCPTDASKRAGCAWCDSARRRVRTNDHRAASWRRAGSGEYAELAIAGLGGVFLLGGSIVHWTHGPVWLRLALLAVSYLLCGQSTFFETVKTLREFRFDIDVLMFAAAFGAAALGHFEEGALLLFLFALGGAGENLAMGKARQAIGALAKLAPETATLRAADGTEREVRVESLGVGDRIVVRPFDRMPADGVVAEGASAVDQSPITGESTPIEKIAGAVVYAGTINGEGLLLVEVSRAASESTLAKIVRMVAEAQAQRSPTEEFTQRVERWYVPLVLVLTAALIVVGPLSGIMPRQEGGKWAGWFYQAMAFLTAASPCALAIGTPAAVLSGIARAARLGVLVKGGAHLESLGRVRAIAFDKTGTLTQGRPAVTDVVAIDAGDADEALLLAAAVERGSSHPLAEAIVAHANGRDATMSVEQIEQVSGMGMRAMRAGQRVLVGNWKMMRTLAGGEKLERISGELASAGKSVVAVALDEKCIAAIALADQPRPNAVGALAALKRAGIEHTIMLSGDDPRVVETVARSLGVDEHFGGLLPREKLERIGELQKRYGDVAMVGDGVNDAPALASASVGIAMGGAGTDVALETADVALMADDLEKLPQAIGLSRFSRRIIRQNLTIALGVIAVLAPLAAMGFAWLGVAVLFHEGSTVVVVLNSMRILAWRPERADRI